MHELPLARQIIGIASQAAAGRSGGRVKTINLTVGDGSGYVADCVKLYFDLISEGTPCEGAELKIERVRPMLRCGACGGLFERRPFEFVCPDCGGEGEPTEIGREFRVSSVEIQD